MFAVPHIIFVHGAWVDETCWAKARLALAKRGLSSSAVHLSLDSLAHDAIAVEAAIREEGGPVVLVGHSYGGAVITEAGTASNVVGLVYINAFLPDIGESALGLTQDALPSRMSEELRPDAAGRLTLTRAGVEEGFAQDVDAATKEALFVQQRPTSAAALTTTVTRAAWRTRPSWYLVATCDNAIPPVLQRAFVAKAKAVSAETHAGHCSMLSRPTDVADLVTLAVQSFR